jgi:hypothetical protein
MRGTSAADRTSYQVRSVFLAQDPPAGNGAGEAGHASPLSAPQGAVTFNARLGAAAATRRRWGRKCPRCGKRRMRSLERICRVCGWAFPFEGEPFELPSGTGWRLDRSDVLWRRSRAGDEAVPGWTLACGRTFPFGAPPEWRRRSQRELRERLARDDSR